MSASPSAAARMEPPALLSLRRHWLAGWLAAAESGIVCRFNRTRGRLHGSTSAEDKLGLHPVASDRIGLQGGRCFFSLFPSPDADKPHELPVMRQKSCTGTSLGS